jgi:SAM-dependent methyltransferase
MRLLDLGCGPASITAGLAEAVGDDGVAIGFDGDPGPAGVPLVAGDVFRLPFRERSFDAVFSSAVLQHLPDPLAALVEVRRVCAPGAVVGLADADWGGALVAPPNPLLDRGQQILEALYVAAVLGVLGAAASLFVGWMLPVSLAAIVFGVLGLRREEHGRIPAFVGIGTGIAGLVFSCVWIGYYAIVFEALPR